MPVPSKQKALRNGARSQTKKQSVPAGDVVQHRGLPVELQQAILNIFTQAFPIAPGHDLKATIQEVKGHLFRRDFVTAFSKEIYLDAYALRWSASRALAYTDIIARSSRHAWFSSKQASNSSAKAQSIPGATLSADDQAIDPTRIVCIGGGAGAEIVALASTSRYLSIPQQLEILAIDIANWTEPVNKISTSITTAPPVSTYASEVNRLADRAFFSSEKLTVKFLHRDILSFSSAGNTTQTKQQQRQTHDEFHASSLHDILPGVTLCTMMFTLNELFSTSISKTTAMLLSLTDAMDTSSWLVVVDSPGSYSEIQLGKTGEMKKYPMKWLLDHTLLEMAGEGKWTKTEDQDSVWFRIEDRSELRYPLELENMRYQIHVYQRI